MDSKTSKWKRSSWGGQICQTGAQLIPLAEVTFWQDTLTHTANCKSQAFAINSLITVQSLQSSELARQMAEQTSRPKWCLYASIVYLREFMLLSILFFLNMHLSSLLSFCLPPYPFLKEDEAGCWFSKPLGSWGPAQWGRGLAPFTVPAQLLERTGPKMLFNTNNEIVLVIHFFLCVVWSRLDRRKPVSQQETEVGPSINWNFTVIPVELTCKDK